MKTPHALLMTLGLASSLAAAQSTSNPSVDMQQAPPDVRTQPGTQTSPQSLGTPSPAQSGTAPSESRLGTQSATQPGGQSEPNAQYGMPQSSGTSGTPGTSSTSATDQSSGPSQTSSTAQSSFDTRPAPAPMSKVEPQTVNGVTYMCGGVGANETAMMKQSARDYDMMLTFATKTGQYLADVNVDIKDAKGNSLVQTRCSGPIMLVDFPQGGTYRVHAEAGGYSLNKTARISGKQNRTARLVMHWPQQIGEEATSTGSSGNMNNTNSGGPADPTGQNK